jgi:multiple sugar transport system substrate-binding protein
VEDAMPRNRGGWKRRAGLIAALLLLAALTARPAAADDTLKFISYQKDEKGVGDWFVAVIKEFEATHPGVHIEFTKVEPGAYAETMTTLFAGGSPPDIVHLAAFDYPKFAANGWREDLDPYIKKSSLDLKGWAGQDKCRWKGQTLCIMNLYFGFFMAYNDEMLAKAGVSVPKNYAEFLEAAKETTIQNGGITEQYGTGHEIGAGVSWYVTEMLNYMLPLGAFWTNAKGEVTLDTPQMIQALAEWKTVNRSGIMPRDPKPGDTRQLLIDGKEAMKIDGPWLAPIIAQAKPDIRKHLKLTASPLQPPVGGTSNVLAMARDIPEAHKKLVWDFLMIETSDKFQTLLGTLGQSLPSSPRADLAVAKAQNPDLSVLLSAQRTASDVGIDRIPPGLEAQYNEFGKMIMDEAQRMIINDLDPASVAKTMQRRAVEIQQGP